MSCFLCPQYFNDVEVPWLDGHKILSVNFGTREYRFYLSWLAEHLLERADWRLVDPLNGTRDAISTAWKLGDDAFWHYEFCVEPYEELIEKGISYGEAFRLMQREHQEVHEGLEPECIIELHDWINPEVWENARREYRESRFVEAQHLDIGYRHRLAEILIQIENHSDRILALREFYRAFNDYD